MTKDQTPAKSPERSTPLFQSMQHEMGQFFDHFRNPISMPGEFFKSIGASMFPPIDVSESNGTLEITAEIPGVNEDDIDISISNDVLVLKGEKSSDHEEKKQDYHLVERRFGSFRRQIPLGFVPAKGAVKATFGDGVLKLAIAKPEGSKEAVQKIKISGS